MLAARNARSTDKRAQEKDSSSASGNLAARTGVPDAPDFGAVGWNREQENASSSRSAKALQVSRFEFRETGAPNLGFWFFSKLETGNWKLTTAVKFPARLSW